MKLAIYVEYGNLRLFASLVVRDCFEAGLHLVGEHGLEASDVYVRFTSVGGRPFSRDMPLLMQAVTRRLTGCSCSAMKKTETGAKEAIPADSALRFTLWYFGRTRQNCPVRVLLSFGRLRHRSETNQAQPPPHRVCQERKCQASPRRRGQDRDCWRLLK